jgi:hypothetical protein
MKSRCRNLGSPAFLQFSWSLQSVCKWRLMDTRQLLNCNVNCRKSEDGIRTHCSWRVLGDVCGGGGEMNRTGSGGGGRLTNEDKLKCSGLLPHYASPRIAMGTWLMITSRHYPERGNLTSAINVTETPTLRQGITARCHNEIRHPDFEQYFLKLGEFLDAKGGEFQETTCLSHRVQRGGWVYLSPCFCFLIRPTWYIIFMGNISLPTFRYVHTFSAPFALQSVLIYELSEPFTTDILRVCRSVRRRATG